MIKHIFVFLVAVASAASADSDRASIVVQAGHTAKVNAIAADTNRDLVATASNDYTVRLWKITPPGTGTLLRVFTGHSGFVEDVTFNVNDEQQLASCSRDMTLRFWNVVTGSGQRIDLSERPSCLAYRPFSNIIAVGSAEAPEVSFYDANNGSPTDRPFTTAAAVTKVAYSKNGDQLACGLVNGRVEIRDARSKDLVRTVPVSRNKIVFVGFKGASVVAISSDGTCVLIPAQGDLVTRMIPGFVLHASITPGHDTLDVATDAPAVVRIPLATMELSIQPVSAKQLDVVVATKRGDLLGYGESGSQRYSWFLQQHGQTEFTSIRTYSDIQTAVTFSHDASMVAVGDNSGSVTVWDLKRPRTPLRFTDMGFVGIRSLAFSSNDSTLVVGGFGGAWLATIDLANASVINTLRGERDAAMVATNNTTSAWVHDSRANELMSASTTGPTRTLVLKNVRMACMSEDATRVIALVAKDNTEAGNTDSVVVLDAGSRVVIARRPASLKLVSSITAPGDGSNAICGTHNGSIVTVSTSTGKSVSERRGAHTGTVNWIAKVGEQCVSAGNDASVRVWSGDVGSKSTDHSLFMHSGQVRSVALSADATMLASSSNDGTVCITRIEKNIAETRTLFTLVMMEGDWAVFSSDGHFDASESAMRLLKVVSKLEAFPIGSLRDSLYRPHLLSGNAGVVAPSMVLMQIKLPPSIQIIEPKMSMVVDTSLISLSYRVNSVAAGSTKIRIHDNDKLVSIATSEQPDNGVFSETTPVELVKGVNQLRVVVYSSDGLEAEDTVTIVYVPKEPPKPRMFIVAVGINTYKNPDYALAYARSDAESVIEVLQKAAPKELSVEVAQIFDDDADVDAVIEALQTVEEHARPDDSFIFYYAGHGAVLKTGSESSYCFALHDVTNVNDAKNLRDGSLMADTLRAYLMRIKALRQSVIIDACYSGMMMQSFSESDNAGYVSGIQRSTGATVMASVLPDKRAKEVDALKHGLFTYAIVKGLEGAARDSDGEVTLFSLLNYISKAMPSLCKATGFAYQQPVVRYEGAAQSFVLSTK